MCTKPWLRLFSLVAIALVSPSISEDIKLFTRTSVNDPKYTWTCTAPTAAQAVEYVGDGNPNFLVKPVFDPVGISGGCMPDATCVAGVSAWTNVFG